MPVEDRVTGIHGYVSVILTPDRQTRRVKAGMVPRLRRITGYLLLGVFFSTFAASLCGTPLALIQPRLRCVVVTVSVLP